jgi:DNA polymerase/3'-5' exonuclease PolX
MGTNKIISDMFFQMADVLASQTAAEGHHHSHIFNQRGGRDNHFKVLAYRKAAKVLADYPVDVKEAYHAGGIKALTAIPGIGAALSKKIAEFIDTGRMHKYDEVMAQRPKEREYR